MRQHDTICCTAVLCGILQASTRSLGNCVMPRPQLHTLHVLHRLLGCLYQGSTCLSHLRHPLCRLLQLPCMHQAAPHLKRVAARAL